MNLKLFNYAEILALVTGLFFVRHIYGKYRYFILYLLVTVIVEIGGKYLGYKKLYLFNSELFNVFTTLEFLFFFYLFNHVAQRPVLKATISWLSAGFFAFALINQLFMQGIARFNSYSMLLGTICIILFVFFYFYEAFENTDPVNLIKDPMFWVSTGIFLFYLGDFTFNLMYPYLEKNNLKQQQRLFFRINHNLIVFEYICFTIALFVCRMNHLALKQQSSRLA